VSEPDPIELDEEEAELVAKEAESAARVFSEPRRGEAMRLAATARSRSIPPDLVDLLGNLLVASLQGGRARRVYLAEGERVLTGVLRRTPMGRELQQRLDTVNRALAALSGRTLDEVKVGMRTAGHFTFSVNADGVSVTLTVGPDGLGVESLTA
jgi:hypothetical protein